MRTDFDEFSSTYTELMQAQHGKFGDIGYYSEHKALLTKEILGINHLNILEFGCGVGRNLKYLENTFKNSKIYAFDISEESVVIAKKSNPDITFLPSSTELKSNIQFDLIFIAGVYHHISPDERSGVMEKLVEHLAKNGKIICFEHNPYNPLTRRMVNTCEFDKDAVLLNKNEMDNIFINHGLHIIESGYTLFMPPKLKKFNFIEKYLKYLPLGGQYYSIAQVLD